MACHRELFRFPDIDDRERRLPLGKRGCEDFLEIGERFKRLVARDPAGFSVDQVGGPSGPFPLDRTPVDACKLRGDLDRTIETESLPKHGCESF
jgi:hypothetical protein